MRNGHRSSWLIAALLTSSACGGGADNQQAAQSADDKKIVIAMVAKSSTNPVFLAARTGAEAAARDLSKQHGLDIQIMWLTPPQEDGQVQAQRIQQAVNDGADAISCPRPTLAKSPALSTTPSIGACPS
jgi:ribose transport system substrate-binding protein